MTLEQQKILIQHYIAAYNSFDVDGMLALVHPEVIFTNVADGQVNAEARGVNNFRDMALQSKALFSSRHQKMTNFKCVGDVTVINIAYEGVLAIDLANGMKAGTTLRLNGRSEFEFKDDKIYRITDFS